MHKIVKMGLSVSVAFVMNVTLACGMEEDTFPVTVQSKLKESPRALSPFDFTKTFLEDVQKLIVQGIIFEQCLENKSPVNVALVCKEWRDVVKEEMKVGHEGWKAWYGVVGFEDIYERFLKGALVYRPNEGSDEGKIELPIAALTNPLGGTFDLSSCRDTGQYLSIATGYRKGKIAANAYKVEVWLAPRFLIEKELNGKASHFAPIMSSWDAKIAPIGMFFTWGGWNNLGWYDYLTSESMDDFGSENLLKKYQKEYQRLDVTELHANATKFHISFVN